MGTQGQKYTHTHTHTHTQREGGRRSQTLTIISDFKNARAVLGENVTAWLRAWVALAGRERQRTGTEFRTDWKVDKKEKPTHNKYS